MKIMNKNIDEIADIEQQAEHDIHVAIQRVLDKAHDKGVCINDISFSIASQERLCEALKKPIVCGVQARSSNRDFK